MFSRTFAGALAAGLLIAACGGGSSEKSSSSGAASGGADSGNTAGQSVNVAADPGGAPHGALTPIEVLADFNAADPLGIEGTDAQDDIADYDGKRVLGALAIGGPKMKVHKACIERLFETNEAVLDVDGVYEIAKELGAKDLGAEDSG